MTGSASFMRRSRPRTQSLPEMGKTPVPAEQNDMFCRLNASELQQLEGSDRIPLIRNGKQAVRTYAPSLPGGIEILEPDLATTSAILIGPFCRPRDNLCVMHCTFFVVLVGVQQKRATIATLEWTGPEVEAAGQRVLAPRVIGQPLLAIF
jgi:hypothetical protein